MGLPHSYIPVTAEGRRGYITHRLEVRSVCSEGPAVHRHSRAEKGSGSEWGLDATSPPCPPADQQLFFSIPTTDWLNGVTGFVALLAMGSTEIVSGSICLQIQQTLNYDYEKMCKDYKCQQRKSD
ncbi:Hypothetical predicted protein [Xyrichtys novacula]|uniref:Uncharacterized protein n=1 Tax=Xyrichtys novacula TaxID=13765 RepID=A0AAV1FA07_XYRNO|nr:Hypothetical predicted protein [Xyrichtys novacula]